MLVCQNCGARHSDPGGDPRRYACTNCGWVGLMRELPTERTTGEAGAYALAGALLGAIWGPGGAVIGGFLGGLIGAAKGRGENR